MFTKSIVQLNFNHEQYNLLVVIVWFEGKTCVTGTVKGILFSLKIPLNYITLF